MRTGKINAAAIASVIALVIALPQAARAHCDTLDGPVIQDARKAIEAKDVTPVLKWVRPKDEQEVRLSFAKALAAKGKQAEAARNGFFARLVKIHRDGESAPFTGLKPAGTVEPAVAAADEALAGGSADALVKLVTEDVANGIRKRFRHAAETYKRKDNSIAEGREFVKAYVEYTHYVERLHQNALSMGHHAEHRPDLPQEHHEAAEHRKDHDRQH